MPDHATQQQPPESNLAEIFPEQASRLIDRKHLRPVHYALRRATLQRRAHPTGQDCSAQKTSANFLNC
jgi:hypothetical protein